MPNALEEFSTWMTENQGNVEGILTGSMEFIALLTPKAAADGKSVQQFLGAIDDPMVLRQIADGVGLAGVAGANGVSVEAILQATLKLVGVVGAIAGLV